MFTRLVFVISQSCRAKTGEIKQSNNWNCHFAYKQANLYHHSWNIQTTFFLALLDPVRHSNMSKCFPWEGLQTSIAVPTPHYWREKEYCQKNFCSPLSPLYLSAIFIQVEIMKICRAGSQWHFIGYWARQPSSRIITGGLAVTHGGGYQLLLSIPGRVCSLQSGACIESLGGRGVCSLTTNRQPAVRPQTNICWLE